MKKLYLLFFALSITHISFAQITRQALPSDTLNWSFEQFDLNKNVPHKWHLMSPNARQYQISSDSTAYYTGSSSVLISSKDTATAPKYAGLGYLLPTRYIGKEMTVRAWMKTENMKGSLALMLGIYDAGGNTLQFENLQGKRLKGSKNWKQYSVTLPLPNEAQNAHIGPILIGKGKLWIDDIEVLIDGIPIQQAKINPAFNPNPPVNPNYGNVESAGGYIKLRDAKIYYEVYGAGEPLLLLHGNSGSIHAFLQTDPRVIQKFQGNCR